VNSVNNKITQLSESQQDYLRIILRLIHHKRVARIKEIARQRGVSMPSATEAVRKLADDGFLSYAAREFIELTPQGEQSAQYLANRNLFMQNFLTDILGLDEQQAATEACAMEHHLNQNTLERFVLLYQFFTHCPKQDRQLFDDFKHCLKSITNPEVDHSYQCCFETDNFPHYGESRQNIHILLADLKTGQRGRILLLAPESEIRHALIEKGLLPGFEIQMLTPGDAQKACTIQIYDRQIRLTPTEAGLVEVEILSDKEKDQ
jgi:DtxR family Mn-dependent transcriptional regulator